jgi:hypothetical protein
VGVVLYSDHNSTVVHRFQMAVYWDPERIEDARLSIVNSDGHLVTDIALASHLDPSSTEEWPGLIETLIYHVADRSEDNFLFPGERLPEHFDW